MPTLAAIDVGSNGFRLIIGEIDADRKQTIKESVREPVRLGQEVFAGGQIPDETIERAEEAFRRFKELIDQHAVKWTRAVATSAAREASNSDIFVDRVAQASGIELSVIGPEEEARLIHLAVAARIPLKGKLGMLIDIGGGSAEITLTSDGQIMTTESFRMGAVRLLQVLEEKRHGTKKFNQLVREYADAAQKRIQKEIGSRTIDVCIGTGGNIESLGDLRRDVLGKESNALLLADELDTLVKKLQGMTYEQRIQELLLRPDRADVIVPASIVVQKILKVAQVSEMQIPGVGLKDGLLIDMIQELYGEKKAAHRDQVMASALQIGRKYMFDEQHGVTTAKHAAKLFDETRPIHRLTLEYRLLLEVAALLHDIGHFINMTAHHKHTLYLLNATPIIGLTPEQMAVVANVARYHRKSFPKPQHEQYRVLSPKDRVVVSKLAGLLRLADAMDNEHSARVTDFDVQLRKPKLTLTLKGEGDLLLERWSLAKKSDLFTEIFSTKVVVSD
ncbi:MAG: Ppx/GppA family phosphatase [Ignavibacteria bacterium]|nr:Ppx/GppA family phosphatase [Ignavibacteria bacterium]